MTRTGRCLCGAVAYEIDGDLLATVICHCDHCQRQSGGAFSVNLIVLDEQLTVHGTLASYDETSDDGETVFVHRRFCAGCGSPIMSELVQARALVAVKVGTLDDKTDVQPTAEVWCVDRQAWVELPDMAVSLERE